MKSKFFLIPLLSFFIISCNNQPDCNDNDSKQLAKELIIQEMNENIGKTLSMLGTDISSNIDDFVNNYVEIKSIRVSAKDKELKKCDCATQIEFNIPEELIEKAEQYKSNFNSFFINSLKNQFSSSLDYEYSLQFSENEDEELFIEGFVPTDEIQEVFMNYTMLKKSISELEKKNNKINDEQKDLDENLSETISKVNEEDIEKAKLWLDNSIKKSNEDLKYEETILSPKYKSFLNDASAYIWGGDSDLTEDEVNLKWGKEYDISKIDNFSLCGNGSSGEIISETKFKELKNNSIIIFETMLKDNGSNESCKKEISVVKINNTFYINKVYSL